jgi:RNA 2',3'-cyclic 3'-phosphodiesterase
VAVLLDEAVRSSLGAEIDRLRSLAGGVSWVAPVNLHVTLKFLGGVDPGRLDAVRESLVRAVEGLSTFDLVVEGLGAFPSATRPRVIWGGVASGREAMVALAEGVERELAALGFARETRAFSPHVTLGRVREPRPNRDLAAAIERGRGLSFGAVRVDRVSLMRSDLSPHGARYTELGFAPLA